MRQFDRRRLVTAMACIIAIFPALNAVATAPPSAQPTVWTSSLPAAEGQDHLSAFADGTAYAQWGSGIARSTDFGVTFSQLPVSPPGITGTSGIVRFATPQIGYAIGGGLPEVCGLPTKGTGAFPLYATHDGGSTWTPACPPLVPLTPAGSFVPSPTGMYASRDGRTLFVAGEWEPSTCQSLSQIKGMVFVTSDGGKHWTTTSLPGGTAAGWEVGSIRDAKHWTLLAGKLEGSCSTGTTQYNQYVYATTDGVHLRKVFNCPASSSCSAATFVTTSRIVVGLADGRTFISARGTTFNPGQTLRSTTYQPLIDKGAVDANYFWIQAFSFASDRVGYASTRGSGTWRTTDGGISWQQETSPECVYYPFGVGDIASGGTDHGITGGPRNIDARIPGGTSLGCGNGTNPQAVPALPQPTQIVASWTVGTRRVTLGPTGVVTTIS